MPYVPTSFQSRNWYAWQCPSCAWTGMTFEGKGSITPRDVPHHVNAARIAHIEGCAGIKKLRSENQG